MADTIKDLQEQIKDLVATVEKLTKRNRLLTKRVKKLSEENLEVCEEMDKIEAINEKVGIKTKTVSEACPNCGSSVTRVKLPDGKTQLICDNLFECNYRMKI